MKRIHIVGRKNSGKTTLIVELIQEFTRQGFRVGTIKHTHHDHELDTPGKDSHRHRIAGSIAVGILSKQMNAIFWPKSPHDVDDPVERKYQHFDTMMRECDLVLVEGDAQASAIKIEVYRTAIGSEPLAANDPTIAAIITDDRLTAAQPTWRRSGVHLIANHIQQLLQLNLKEG